MFLLARQEATGAPKAGSVFSLCVHWPEPPEVNAPLRPLCGHHFAKAAMCLSHLTSNLFALHMPHARPPLEIVRGPGMALHDTDPQGSASPRRGKDFTHKLIKCMSNPIPEFYLERPFSGDTSGGNYCISQGPSKEQMARSER